MWTPDIVEYREVHFCQVLQGHSLDWLANSNNYRYWTCNIRLSLTCCNASKQYSAASAIVTIVKRSKYGHMTLRRP